MAVKGPSSAGKSYLVEQVLRLFPESAYHALSAMSEHALVYDDTDLVHRFLVIYEAAGMNGDIPTYIIRTLLSEGRLRYTTVEKAKGGSSRPDHRPARTDGPPDHDHRDQAASRERDTAAVDHGVRLARPDERDPAAHAKGAPEPVDLGALAPAPGMAGRRSA